MHYVKIEWIQTPPTADRAVRRAPQDKSIATIRLRQPLSVAKLVNSYVP
jgi:hypothetical protein